MREGRMGHNKQGFSTSMWAVAWNLLLLASVVTTSVLAYYSLTISRSLTGTSSSASLLHAHLTQELRSLRQELTRTQRHVAQAQLRITATTPGKPQQLLPSELLRYIATRELPLGRNPSYGETTMVSPIGHACYHNMELLSKYMSYAVGKLCPDDWNIAQDLIMRGCEPLPRRRCFSPASPAYSKPLPLPKSLWSYPPDGNLLWTHYTCKSFDCLRRRAKESRVFTDCADCFDFDGPEKSRWVNPRDGFGLMSIKQLLALKRGSIRVGLDLGGGSGSFAARMKEHNVTIITSTLNLNGPFNEFVALRGLLPLYITIGHRLPFFDNTLDLVHSMHVLSHWIPPVTLQFALYDIDRVIRPGGLFWLDHFFCRHDQLSSIYVPMIEGLGYQKLKWITGNKTDPNGIRNKEVYLSALLEKPVRGT